ncbi:MAG: hypothetical protein IKB20_01195 [Clostridia bacterium]|nr:hypothetical protein [Clostridia bacterium]
MRNSWKRLLALLCGACMSVFAGFALASCKNPEDSSSSSESSVEQQAHEHSWDGGEVKSTSTCTRQGETVFTCTTCGGKKVEYAPLAAHDYKETSTIAPTCTTKGYTISQCSVCFDEIRGEFTDATGHEYETSVQPATCTSHEITTYDCKHCDEDDYTEITSPTTGHNTQGATWVVASATPVEGGPSCMYILTESTTCQNAGCGATITRTVAEPVHKANYSHEITTPATCTTEGVITYTCACGDSKYTYTTNYAGIGHEWDEGVEVNGVKTFTCAHDSTHTKQTVVAVKDTENKKATLSTDALNAAASDKATEVEVTDNTKMQMDTALLGALASATASEVTFIAEELTSDNMPDGVDTSRLEEGATVYNFDLKDASGNPLFGEGSTGSMTITVSYTLEDGEDPSSIVVLWLKDNGDVVSSPAIYDAVEGTATFTVNHFSYYTVVRMTAEERCARDGHKNVTVVVPNDCTHGGYTLSICGVCGKEERTNITNPTGHNYVPTVVAPTCTDRGYTRYACTNAGCQDSYVSNLVDKVDHVYADSVVAPTCTEKGYTAHSCTFCGTTYRDTYTAATGHSFANGVCGVCGEDAPESYLNANNFYFNLIQSVSEQDRFYLEVEDISFTADVVMEDMEAVVVSEVDMYRFAFRLDKNGYIVGQGEGKVNATMTQIEDGESMTMVEDMEMIVVFQNGKIYMFQKLAETENGQTNRQTVYSMIPQDEVPMDDMKEMYKQVFGDSISNILKGMLAQENNPANKVMATVLEYVFTKTETTGGYTFTANYDALPGIYDGLTEMTVAEVYDAIFGEGAYVKAYNYIYSVPEKTIEQVRNDIVAWAMKFGVDIKDVYAAINALANNMPTGGFGGTNGPESGSNGGAVQDKPMPEPTNAGTEPEPKPFSIEEIITQYRDMTVAQILDMMMEVPEGETGLEQYKAMIEEMGKPADANGENGGMLAMMSIADIALGMGVGENEAMLEMITGIMAFVDEQLTALAEALEGTSSMSFTTDKDGNLLSLAASFTEFEHELTVDGAIVAMLSGGDMESDVSVSMTANGSVNVVMGGSYIGEYDHIITSLEKSKAIFDIKQTLELTKKEERYIDKEEDIKVYYDRDYVLVPSEKGVLYAPAFNAANSEGSPFDMQEDTYQGQDCLSFKVRVWGATPLLLAPEQGITYAESCNGWRKYTSKAYYCHRGAVYKVYTTQSGGYIAHELDVELTTENAGEGSAYETMVFYYNAGLNQYSLNDPHNWILTKTELPEKCGDSGYHAYRCSVCGNEMVENLYWGHESYQTYQLVTPGTTCADGLKEVYICRICGEVTHENEVSEEYAATHPTNTVRMDPPNKTSDTCPKHCMIQTSCACGQKQDLPWFNQGYEEFSCITSYTVAHDDENVYHNVWIYRCPVNACAYTYASEEYTVRSTANCTETVTRTLHAGINYEDGTETFTGGTSYTKTTVNDWHATGEATTSVDGNVITYTYACVNCHKPIDVYKYERLTADVNGSQRTYEREIYNFHYEYENKVLVNGYGWRREYDGNCNCTEISLRLKDGQIVDGGSYSEIRHSYVGTTISEPTCSQFGLEQRYCLGCHMSTTTKTVDGWHDFGYDSEVGAHVCYQCGMVSDTGANGAFTLEDMTKNGVVKVGFLNKYGREYDIRVFVNYHGDRAVELAGLTWNVSSSFVDESDWANNAWWIRWAESGTLTLDMNEVMNAIDAAGIINAETLTVVFETEVNYEAEDKGMQDALEYGITFEIGKAGTYKLAGWAEYNGAELDTSVNPDDFVITLNSDFTYTIETANGIQAFSNSGDWRVYGDKIRLYGPNGEYDDINADLCLWNEYGYWYFEMEKVGTYMIDTTEHTDVAAEDCVITLYSNSTYTMTSASGLLLFSESGGWEVGDDGIYLYNADGNYALLDANLFFEDFGGVNDFQMVKVD